MKPMQGDIKAHEERRTFWSFRKLCEGKEERNYFLEAKNCFYSKIVKTIFEKIFGLK